MENIMDIILRVAGTLAACGLAYLAKVAASEIRAFVEKYNLEKYVASLVSAAEQTLKEMDDNGSLRREWVQGMLIEAGYDLTEAVMALVESKVYELNQAKGAGSE